MSTAPQPLAPAIAAALGLDADGAAVIAHDGVPFAFASGAVVFRSGDPCPGYFLLRDGVLSVRERTAAGREIEIYQVRPGEACLQTAVCVMGGSVYTAEGVVTQAADGVLLPQAAFEKAMAVSSAFRRMIMRSIAHRLQDFSRTVESVAFRPLPARLAAALLAVTGETSAAVVTHDRLAGMVGGTRETISRILGGWERRGYVALQRGRIDVRDRDMLMALADAAS